MPSIVAVVLLGFDQEVMNIFEGDEGEFCATTAIEYDRFNILGVDISTADGTATGSIRDHLTHLSDIHSIIIYCT